MNQNDDDGNDQVKCLGICNWLYNLITKTIYTQTLKTVTLGQTQGQIIPSKIDMSSSSKAIDFATKRAPKKTVSINDKVEEIVVCKRNASLKILLPRNRRRSFSMDFDDKDDEKPLKSILKVSKGGGNNFLVRSTSFG